MHSALSLKANSHHFPKPFVLCRCYLKLQTISDHAITEEKQQILKTL